MKASSVSAPVVCVAFQVGLPVFGGEGCHQLVVGVSFGEQLCFGASVKWRIAQVTDGQLHRLADVPGEDVLFKGNVCRLLVARLSVLVCWPSVAWNAMSKFLPVQLHSSREFVGDKEPAMRRQFDAAWHRLLCRLKRGMFLQVCLRRETELPRHRRYIMPLPGHDVI
jgi:hypothetical protein